MFFFAFYTEIRDGHQKVPDDSASTLWVEKFIATAISQTISEINEFLHYAQKFKMATKNIGKMFFGKKSSR